MFNLFLLQRLFFFKYLEGFQESYSTFSCKYGMHASRGLSEDWNAYIRVCNSVTNIFRSLFTYFASAWKCPPLRPRFPRWKSGTQCNRGGAKWQVSRSKGACSPRGRCDFSLSLLSCFEMHSHSNAMRSLTELRWCWHQAFDCQNSPPFFFINLTCVQQCVIKLKKHTNTPLNSYIH